MKIKPTVSLLLGLTMLLSLFWNAASFLSPSPTAVVSAEGSSEATVYYYKPYRNWTSVHIHHNGGGSWTAVPGTAMASACQNWAVYTVNLGSASSMLFLDVVLVGVLG